MSEIKINRDDIPEIVVVVNGPLNMSPGKIAGQTFQAAMRMLPTSSGSFWGWYVNGTRTVVKIATTPAIFKRVCDEVPGYIMKDEGHTEVEPGAATVFVSHPFLHKDRPVILDNKKVRLL